VLPTRVKKPKDKGKVENGVQNVERWVIAPLRKRTFFSLAALNQAIREQIEVLNNKIMLAVGRSRRQEFEDIDRPNLRSLPEKAYEYAARKTARVNIDYHVEFDKHLYSVPYRLIHQEVEIHATEHMLEIFHKGQSVAVHPRSFRLGRFSTRQEHMPPNHQFVDQVNAQNLLRWADNIGPQTQAFMNATLHARPFPEQAYRSCLGVLSLAKKHPHAHIEQACQAVLDAKTFSYKAVKEELDWLAKQPVAPETLPAHANIRGHDYYQ
jgi:transposase